MAETTEYDTFLKETFQSYYKFITYYNCYRNGDSINETARKKIKEFAEILSPECLLLATPSGKLITSYEDVRTLEREVFNDKKYPPHLSVDREENLCEYFYVQYGLILKRLASKETLEKKTLNDTVFFDVENGYLWLDSNEKEKIEPEDAKILKAIIDIFTSNNRSACRIEEVCSNAFHGKLSTKDKIINNPMYGKYRSAASAINNKYRKLLKTNDRNYKLIRANGNRNIKLSKNVVFRNMFRKQT
ncbi:hypothetical protein [uncultured Candidatus Kuenenia sp.]|uniref:hypothetical protein n=1 Tax=uncultured Candidatus Kuenenia sp. TaxID=1048336 RepID=UPI0003036473|nr:hypothetical protein [uncultured Candidatus Kuenenia sp.]GJQ48600.1 MAG: hypothetical protein HKUEN01_09860 [Candidatus Kuenenia stuttgartiensis]